MAVVCCRDTLRWCRRDVDELYRQADAAQAICLFGVPLILSRVARLHANTNNNQIFTFSCRNRNGNRKHGTSVQHLIHMHACMPPSTFLLCCLHMLIVCCQSITASHRQRRQHRCDAQASQPSATKPHHQTRRQRAWIAHCCVCCSFVRAAHEKCNIKSNALLQPYNANATRLWEKRDVRGPGVKTTRKRTTMTMRTKRCVCVPAAETISYF